MTRVAGLTPRRAVALQERRRDRVIRRRTFRNLRRVAGVDISIRNDRARAAVVVLRWPGMEPLEIAAAVRPVEFPYVPGLLAFREIPSILDAFRKLKERPDILFVDGQGLAHPRRFGIACHLGVELDLPSLGCGKSRLVGEHRDPAKRRGARATLRHGGEVVGSVVRTRDGVKPVYISIGHRIDLATAVRLVLRACSKYRLPEPIRCAHRAAGAIP
ncbi:MAG: deoxyribonuclease V [Planctomycetota bacterium]|jgi:deoxyribonuclease V